MKFGLDVLTWENFPHLPVLIWSSKKPPPTHTVVWSLHTMLYPCVVLWNGRKPNLLNVDFFVGLRPRVSVQDHKMKTKTSLEMAAVYLTCDSSRTFSCKSQRRNSLTIDSDSLISLMAPYHSLRWMDVRGCARSNIVTSSPYWLNIQYECIMTSVG